MFSCFKNHFHHPVIQYNAQVSVSSNIGAYFRLAPPTSATATSPKHITALTLTTPPATTTIYGGLVTATVRLTDGTTPVDGKLVDFSFGGHRMRAVTAGGGFATGHFEASFDPTGSPYALTASFAEDDGLLGSSVSANVTIARAASSLTAAGVTYTDRAMLGATLSANGRPLHEELVTITVKRGTTVVATRPTLTDGTGRAQTDIASLPEPGPTGYTAVFDYAGSDFYGPSTATLSAVNPAASVTGEGSIGSDHETTFELDVHVKRTDRDERGDQRGDDQHGKDDGKGKKPPKVTSLLSGHFEFESKTAHIEFGSTSFQTLRVAGAVAEIFGTGMMAESSATWQFRLVVVDGSPDTFELSIWDGTGSLASPRFHVGPSAVVGQIRIR